MNITRPAVECETERRMRRQAFRTGEDIRRMRIEAGITASNLATIVGVHRSHLAMIERGAARPSLAVLTRIGVALGADLGIRYFPGARPRLHDRFQAPMVEAVLRALDPRWHVELEVPVTHPARGVIDLVLTDRFGGFIVAAEVQSEIRRLEQQIRWAAEKADGLAEQLRRDGRLPMAVGTSRLLVLRSTVATREVARRYAVTLAAAYPARSEDVVGALRTSARPWPGPGIVWIRINGDEVRILDHPPRGVAVGR